MASCSSDSRPRIVVLVGLPGCGKSTYVRKLSLPALSSDDIRGLLADDPEDQSLHPRVFSTLRYLLRQRLELRRPVTFIDATNLIPRERRPYIRMAERYGCSVEAIYFDVPVEVCMERNRHRERIVPDEALLRMAAKLRPPKLDEGFCRVTVVRE